MYLTPCLAASHVTGGRDPDEEPVTSCAALLLPCRPPCCGVRCVGRGPGRIAALAGNGPSDTAGPVLSLGEPGAFDDAHIFAPAVALENEAYKLWYCGSRGEVSQRVFRLGLATSSEGRVFRRYSRQPVFALDDEQASILTPTLLRNHDGTTLREDGCLRMWYSSTRFASLPNQRMREVLTWTEYAALSAPDCAVLLMNGDADWVIDRDDDGSAWRGTRKVVRDAGRVFQQLGAGNVQAWWEPGGGHRPYFLHKDALLWIHQHLGTPSMTVDQIRQLPTMNSGQWCDAQGIELEKLYGTPLHQRGATLPHLNLRPIPRELLSCLKPGEQGMADFTIDGWLQQIEAAPTAGDVQP